MIRNYPLKTEDEDTKKQLIITWVIVSLFCISLVVAQDKDFDPFPQNRGTIYEYSDDDICDVCFFPLEKAKWDGSRITAKEWKMLTDFQKVMFISEYIEELEKGHNTTIEEIDVWRLLIALNGFADFCRDECLDEPMTRVIKDLLAEY